MEVRAKSNGWYNGYRKTGDKFPLNKGDEPGSWMKALPEPAGEPGKDYKEVAESLGIPLIDEEGNPRHQAKVRADIRSAQEGEG